MGAKPYPAYRDSGVEWIGEIPEHWEVKRIKQAAHVQLGKKLQPESSSVSDLLMPYLRSVNVQDSSVSLDDVKQMWASPYEVSQYSLRSGDVLVNEGGDVGRCCLLTDDLPSTVFQMSINRLRPLNNGSPGLLFYWMKFLRETGYVELICNKSTIAHFTAEKVARSPLFLPPLEEQKLIASFLDRETGKIDTLVAQQQQLIRLLKEKRQSLISHTVTKGLNPNVRMKDSGVEWIGEIPEHWEVRKVGRSCVVSPKRNKYLLSNLEQMVCFLPMTAFSNDGMADYSNEVALQSVINGYTYMEFGDIAISKVTPCFENGKGARLSDMPTKVGFGTTEVTAIRPLHMSGDFVFYLFRIPEVIDLGVSWMYGVGGLQRIPDAFFEQLEAPFPPLEEQKQVAAFLDTETSKIDELVIKANQSIALLKERRSSLISAAVTGKIDVREAA